MPPDGPEKPSARSEGNNEEYFTNREKLEVVTDVKKNLVALQKALEEQKDPKKKERREKRAKSDELLEQQEEVLDLEVKKFLEATAKSLGLLYKERETTTALAGLVNKLNLTDAVVEKGITPDELTEILDNKDKTTDELGLLAADVDDEIQTIDEYKDSLGVSSFDNVRDRLSMYIDAFLAKNPAMAKKLEEWGIDAKAIMAYVMSMILSLFESLLGSFPKMRDKLAKEWLELEKDGLTEDYKTKYNANPGLYGNEYINEYKRWLSGKKQADAAANNNGTVAAGRPLLTDIIDRHTQNVATPETGKSPLDTFFGDKNTKEIGAELGDSLVFNDECTLKFATKEMQKKAAEEVAYEFVNEKDEIMDAKLLERSDATKEVGDLTVKLSGGNPSLKEVVAAIKKIEEKGTDDKKEEPVEVISGVKIRRKA